MLMSEELARTAIAALYLIANEHCVVRLAKRSQLLEEASLNHSYSANALNALDYHSTHIVLLYLHAPRLDVVERKIGNRAVCIDRSNNLRISSGLDCKRCAAVESLLCRQHTSASVMERRQLKRVLVCLCARVNEEKLIVFVSAHPAQALCQLLLKRVDNGVAIESELAQLASHHIYIVRVAVADANHSVSTVKVKILLPFVVPHLASFSLVDGHIHQRIYIV